MRTEPRFLTVAQVAAALGVSGATIRRWVRDGHLVAVQIGGADGVLRIPEAELERLVAEARQDAMSIAAAADALKAADEALAAAKVIRDGCHEELVAACVADGWRVIFRQRDTLGHERVVFEHLHGGRAMALEDVLAASLREAPRHE
jgi:excisionase family DNA binding protein